MYDQHQWVFIRMLENPDLDVSGTTTPRDHIRMQFVELGQQFFAMKKDLVSCLFGIGWIDNLDLPNEQ